ncbi:MAG: hypothetical protein ACYCO0_04710 [Candidatus Micrarchaeaceae archaeon]
MDENDSLKAYNSIYLEIIMRYKEQIEDKEELYPADLPKLVTPENDNVVLLAKEIQNSFPVYNYDQNFPEAAALAYAYVKDKIIPISLPVQFWLKPEQTIMYGAGDIFDKAVLLCSLLIAMGNFSSRVVVAAKDTDRTFIVYSEFRNKLIAMDLDNGVKDYGLLDDLLKELKVDNDTTAYEFNDKMYRDIA